MLYTSPRSRLEVTTLVVIGTDSIGSCRSNYHMITTTTTPQYNPETGFLLSLESIYRSKVQDWHIADICIYVGINTRPNLKSQLCKIGQLNTKT